MHFYKDNKIWLYENIEDELGFIRITVDWKIIFQTIPIRSLFITPFYQII
jgi:hypothetical protein